MTQNPNLYCIDKKNMKFEQGDSVHDIIEKVINYSYNKKVINEKYSMSNIRSVSRDEIWYHLYLFNTKEQDSDWKEFFPGALTENYDFTIQRVSFILFIETELFLYCIIGGNSYNIIVPFIDHSFGLNTYSRLMNEKEDELASIKTRGITGARAGMNEQFRNSYKLIDFVKFGKVPQEIHVKLSTEISNEFFKFLLPKEGERLNINVSKGFKIKKALDFSDFHRLIQEMSFVMERPTNDYLSSFQEIINSNLIENFFKPELIKRIYDDYSYIGKVSKDTDNRFQFDFCNPNNIQQFYEADEYHIKRRTEKGGYVTLRIINDRNLIYKIALEFAKFDLKITERNDLRNFLQGLRITCYKDGKLGISSMFLYHISTEFPIEKRPVFYIDNKWYYLRDSFISDLLYHTKHILGTYKLAGSILNKPWHKDIYPEEKDYNLEYNKENNYIVLDRIIVEGLELCDILHYTETKIYLIHVKFGFANEVRELTNQILISAKRLREEMGTSDKSLLKSIYIGAMNKGRNLDGLTMDQFVDLFSKSIIYVFAFTSHLKSDYTVAENIEKFNSTIARYSLVSCSGEMRANYYDLETKQIKREL